MPTIKLLKRAELELIDACEWYEKQQRGLSANFRREVKITIHSIDLNPKLYAKRYQSDLRFVPVRIFPYIIVYWYDEQLSTIFITSIFHTKRDPERFENK
ncbi:type II toxin-antitoxin system RelE/ParE family toxin [Mucilaginibacter sp.]|uniref:type II toxin-antitoxin system RelE/ParE family toxin n=1 Tax=Mucilaginibacter sp. TaxID=1882438 RepID=UPI0025EC20C5|nr:type II toxin-antitoxin system RelE/ParE family toxin [Mucilaginibacter sp.]